MKTIKINRIKKSDDIEVPTIPDLLRKLACDELISYHAYITASKNIRGANWLDAKQQFEEHAKDELEHYQSILDRLYQLGTPAHVVFKTVSEACNYYWDIDMEDPKQACEVAKVAEEEAIKGYRNLLIAIAATELEVRDFATQRLAKKNLEAEQDHLQDMIHLIEE